MKRPLTLTSSILATVFLAFSFIFEIIFLIEFINYQYISMVTEITIILVILIIMLFVSLLLNIFIIPIWNKSEECFKKRKPLFISGIVFNFICILLYLIFLILFVNNITFYVVFMILTILALIASNVLYIIEICKEKSKQNEIIVKTKNETEDNNLIKSKIEQFLELKNSGLITDEEYNLLKKSYLEQIIKN